MKTQFKQNKETWSANLTSMLTAVKKNEENSTAIKKFEELAMRADWINYTNRILNNMDDSKKAMKNEFLKNENSWTSNLYTMLMSVRNGGDNSETIQTLKELAFKADWVDFVNVVLTDVKGLKSKLKLRILELTNSVNALDLTTDENNVKKYSDLIKERKSLYGELGTVKQFFRCLKNATEYNKTVEFRIHSYYNNADIITRNFNL